MVQPSGKPVAGSGGPETAGIGTGWGAGTGNGNGCTGSGAED